MYAEPDMDITVSTPPLGAIHKWKGTCLIKTAPQQWFEDMRRAAMMPQWCTAQFYNCHA